MLGRASGVLRRMRHGGLNGDYGDAAVVYLLQELRRSAPPTVLLGFRPVSRSVFLARFLSSETSLYCKIKFAFA